MPNPGQSWCQLTVEKKKRILEEIEHGIGYQPRKISELLKTRGYNVSRFQIMCFYAKYLKSGDLGRKPGTGPSRKLSSAHFALVQSKMEENDETTVTKIHKELSEIGMDISVRTVARARQFLGWECKTTQYCQTISTKNVAARLQWCKEMKQNISTGFSFNNWIFSDECKIEIMQ